MAISPDRVATAMEFAGYRIVHYRGDRAGRLRVLCSGPAATVRRPVVLEASARRSVATREAS
jgi:hypothetical protein